MFNRRKLDRERLEIYLLYLLLANRRILFVSGGVIMMYAIVMIFWSLPAAGFGAMLASFLLLAAFSYRAALYMARLGAWVATLGRRG